MIHVSRNHNTASFRDVDFKMKQKPIFISTLLVFIFEVNFKQTTKQLPKITTAAEVVFFARNQFLYLTAII